MTVSIYRCFWATKLSTQLCGLVVGYVNVKLTDYGLLARGAPCALANIYKSELRNSKWHIQV